MIVMFCDDSCSVEVLVADLQGQLDNSMLMLMLMLHVDNYMLIITQMLSKVVTIETLAKPADNSCACVMKKMMYYWGELLRLIGVSCSGLPPQCSTFSSIYYGSRV